MHARHASRVARLCLVLFASAPALLALVALTGCAAPHGSGSAATADGVQQLLRADAQFERETQERGLDAWMSWFAEDAVRMEIDGFVARGHAEIRQHDAALFADPSVSIHWQPVEGGLEADGRHGWTRGTFQMQQQAKGAAAPTQLMHGHYLTVWRHDAVGWRVVLDTGVTDADSLRRQ